MMELFYIIVERCDCWNEAKSGYAPSKSCSSETGPATLTHWLAGTCDGFVDWETIECVLFFLPAMSVMFALEGLIVTDYVIGLLSIWPVRFLLTLVFALYSYAPPPYSCSGD